MAANRSLVREVVMQTVFEMNFRCHPADRALAVFDYNLALAGLTETNKYDLKLSQALLLSVFEHAIAIRRLIEEYAPQWPFDKIAVLDRSILQVALAELFFSELHIPPAVTLNEYTEIAKKYGDDATRRFVNGVLGAIKKQELDSNVSFSLVGSNP